MDPSFDQMTPAERVLHVQDLWDRIAEEPEGFDCAHEAPTNLSQTAHFNQSSELLMNCE